MIEVGNSIPERLASAYALFRVFCKERRETPMVKHFSRENLNWESLAKYPECSFKGSDTRLMLGFLIDFLQFDTGNTDPISQKAMVAASNMDAFLRLVFTTNRFFLSRSEGLSAYALLCVWNEKVHECARACYALNACFFNLTPKIHYVMHIGADIKLQLDSGLIEILSPALWATQMAEEFIGSACRLGRTVHPSTAVRRSAQKWLVFCKQWWLEEVEELEQ